MARDWVEWHRDYQDPESELSQRLAVVTRAIVRVLDEAPPGPIRVLSLCCGEARDLSGAALDHPRAADLEGCAVELSGGLGALAAQNLRDAGTSVEVRCGDAGRPHHWIDVAPVDLFVIAGIFGNVSDDDIRRIAAAVPAIVRPGGTVVWTRHRRGDDLTPHIREWFDAAGCSPVSFDSPGEGKYGVGVERVGAVASVPPVPHVLFRFVED